MIRRLSAGLLAFAAVVAAGASWGWAGDFHFTVTADPRGYDLLFDDVLAAMQSKAGGQGVFQVAVGDVDPLQPLRDKVDARFGAAAVWYPVVGNHEAETAADMNWIRSEYTGGNGVRTPLKNYTNQNGPAGSVETTYSWDWGNAHFVALNEYWNGSTAPGSDVAADGNIVAALYNWLAADLAANTRPYVFVFGHEPAFPFNRHLTDSLNQYPANRDAFWSLLESEGVDAYFCGHTHYYSKYLQPGGGVWQIDAGNAGNGSPQTFVDVLVGETGVRYDVYNNASGSWQLYETWSGGAPVCEPGTLALMTIGLMSLTSSRLLRQRGARKDD